MICFSHFDFFILLFSELSTLWASGTQSLVPSLHSFPQARQKASDCQKLLN